MNLFLTIIIFMVVLNAMASFVPFLMPRAKPELILPYQLWFNVILVFILILPHRVGDFKLFEKIKQ